MGAALRVSRNNPEPNTKMVALRTAADHPIAMSSAR